MKIYLLCFLLSADFVSVVLSFRLPVISRIARIRGYSTKHESLRPTHIEEIPLSPLWDHILIRPVQSQDTEPDALVIPPSSRTRFREGHAVAVGPGQPVADMNYHYPKSDVPKMCIKIGEGVIYDSTGTMRTHLEGENMDIIKDLSVRLIFDGPKAKLEGLGCVRDGMLLKKRERTKDFLNDANTAATIFRSLHHASSHEGYLEEAYIVKIGPDVKFIGWSPNIGDRVAFLRSDAEEINIDGCSYLFLKSSDLIAHYY